MSAPIRVMLVDDQRLMRDGLRLLLELEPDIEVAAEAENGREALAIFADTKPDVVLMDIRMPEMDGVAATAALCAAHKSARIIILTTFDDDAYLFEGLRAGALGYLLKDVSGEELATAVRTVAGGGALLGAAVARRALNQLGRSAPAEPPPEAPLEPLSAREAEILGWIAQGFSNPEIARQLHLADGTVKNYVSAILQKLNARDRTQAVIIAQGLGML